MDVDVDDDNDGDDGDDGVEDDDNDVEDVEDDGGVEDDDIDNAHRKLHLEGKNVSRSISRHSVWFFCLFPTESTPSGT